MSKKTTVILIIVVLLIIGGAAYLASQMGPSNISVSSGSEATSSGTVAGASTTGELFVNSIYAPYAYLISTNTLDARTMAALSGFAIQTSTNPDGFTQITLNAKNPGYQTQTYTVHSGEQLYFIERSLSDDTQDMDKFPNDDNAVLVDANGYILQIGSPSASSSQGKG
jgi:hypothetical protein